MLTEGQTAQLASYQEPIWVLARALCHGAIFKTSQQKIYILNFKNPEGSHGEKNDKKPVSTDIWLQSESFFDRQNKKAIGFWQISHHLTLNPKDFLQLLAELATKTNGEFSLKDGDTKSDFFNEIQSFFQLAEAKNLALFQDDFIKIQQEIKSGCIEKAVPMTSFTLPRLPHFFQLKTAFEKALTDAWAEQQGFFYFQMAQTEFRQKMPELSLTELIKTGPLIAAKEGFFSISPELLLQMHFPTGILKTMALAGTHRKTRGQEFLSEGEKQSLLNSSKNQQEHQLVVRDLVEKLKNLGELIEKDTFVQELKNLAHLKTPLEIKIKKVDVENPKKTLDFFLNLLHPTPALGLKARGRDLNWLMQLAHQKERGFFGSPFSFYHGGELESWVMIRGLFWGEQKVSIPSGCGIVKESVLLDEWQELLAKRDSVLDLFRKRDFYK